MRREIKVSVSFPADLDYEKGLTEAQIEEVSARIGFAILSTAMTINADENPELLAQGEFQVALQTPTEKPLHYDEDSVHPAYDVDVLDPRQWGTPWYSVYRNKGTLDSFI